ncbi:3-hydroxyacyl-ACP dehydratase FabZ [Clostridium luticellarii]|jgi:3-hydroxyacyl-[acyl-carrier-protein] dehydratase|uniref:3-hydroxyacyl-ACP dehydratase FabZ n=1 Tax=Clostridium luticellarii TaxID=1691940 RepID=UPI0023541C92|nr:3-hydroxyacyl-ACP dehydratase FabZ [Clostridium luticellarii]MCI1944639.1 3-hydroxyacyl-ACP dehydratase FabZ [Clostridium luticellarii]MCI1968138.1 3-hydroxyacyl-ACP dehydratase FabZ [Clostridium luticellarii]MCI1994749.1 3-hydroxyacyl-ACP dehydratase FabZ [Clostridium luticellarii]MCI2038981.1 3-hydroxyacyl-ACP dehydratase FabZ [Clostridium luticellarii]
MDENKFEVNFGLKEIKAIIPHRYPFLLIDKVTYMEPGKKVTAYKNVTGNEYFFSGHFPEEPVMPGVLIIEAMAQAGAVAILSKEEFKNKIAFFGGINRAKFRKKVIPGDTLKLEVEIVKIKGSAGVGKATAYVEDKKAAEAELMFMIGNKN